MIRETQRADLVAVLAPRAVRFHEEWFGAKADELEEILTRVLAVDPAAEWALRRLSVFYTVKERWNDLLALYDRSLAGVDDTTQRRELLTEAVRVAKDFVGDTDRTIGYLTDLQRLSPGDAHLAGQLERLLERQGRWAELAALWRSRVPGLAPAEARALRVRTAALLLDRLGDPAGALAELRPLLADPEAGDAGLPAGREDPAPAGGPGRRCAARRWRCCAIATRPPAARPSWWPPWRRRWSSPARASAVRCTGRWASGWRPPATAGRPWSTCRCSWGCSRRTTRCWIGCASLAESEGDPAVVPARRWTPPPRPPPDSGRKVALWLEAARIHDETVRDPGAAVGYYRRAFRESSADPAARLNAARKLVDRLAEVPDAAEAPGERLVVLEALAAELQTAAPRSGERRAALVETARAAEERGDLERAAAAFNRLLEVDPADRSALDGLVALLERAGQWEALVGALRRRMAVVGTDAEKRADLTRVATLQANELGQPAVAIDTWLEIQRAFVDPDAPAGAADEQITEALAGAVRPAPIAGAIWPSCWARRARARRRRLGDRLVPAGRRLPRSPGRPAAGDRLLCPGPAGQPGQRGGAGRRPGAAGGAQLPGGRGRGAGPGAGGPGRLGGRAAAGGDPGADRGRRRRPGAPAGRGGGAGRAAHGRCPGGAELRGPGGAAGARRRGAGARAGPPGRRSPATSVRWSRRCGRPPPAPGIRCGRPGCGCRRGSWTRSSCRICPRRWTPTGRPTSATPGGWRCARRWCGRRRAAGSGRWRWRRRWPPG